MAVLGEEEEGDEVAFATAERLRKTSLLEQVDLLQQVADGKIASVRHSMLHPATAQLIRERFGESEELRRVTHRRLGEYLELGAGMSPSIEVNLEAGYHLFQAEAYDRAYDRLFPTVQWLLDHGCRWHLR